MASLLCSPRTGQSSATTSISFCSTCACCSSACLSCSWASSRCILLTILPILVLLRGKGCAGVLRGLGAASGYHKSVRHQPTRRNPSSFFATIPAFANSCTSTATRGCSRFKREKGFQFACLDDQKLIGYLFEGFRVPLTWVRMVIYLCVLYKPSSRLHYFEDTKLICLLQQEIFTPFSLVVLLSPGVE